MAERISFLLRCSTFGMTTVASLRYSAANASASLSAQAAYSLRKTSAHLGSR